MELISVIVPVYKVEPYLDRCVQSIVDQTYRNLEIVLIDDGSPDRCGEMCDAWAEKDPRIQVIHKKNGGLSDARNAGMAAATGEYIGFVDSDDYIASNMYQLLLDRMTSDGSDISACGVELVFEDGSPKTPLTPRGCAVLSRQEAMEAVIRESWLKQPVWYKLYKTDQIRDILFPVGKLHEDVFWTWQAVARANRVSVFDTPCYFYLQRADSIMGEPYSLRRLDALEAKECRQSFLQTHSPKLASLGRCDLLFSCLYMGQMSMLHLDANENRIIFNRLKKAMNLYPLTTADKIILPFKQRLWTELARYAFRGTCWLRNRLKIGI